MLREFLEYAEKGTASLVRPAAQLETKTPQLEREIAKALVKEGYKVDVHVGVSGFRIDLAVVHPDDPDVYVLGILCDGATYKSGKTVRDREVLRGQVLKQLGWHIHRVWSLDWLDNPQKELQLIIEAIRSAIREGVEARIATDAAASPQPGTDDGNSGSPLASAAVETSATAMSQPEAGRAEKRLKWAVPYQTFRLPEVGFPAEAFYMRESEHMIKMQIQTLIEREGPISRTLLVRKLLQAWGIARSGSRIDQHISALMSSMKMNKTVWGTAEFYWPGGMDPVQYEVYRVAQDEQSRRSAEDLPPEEIANAVKEVLFVQGSLPQEDLIRETAKLLGYARTGSALEKAISLGIHCALDKGFAESKDGRWRFVM